jgi:hypothetical protein
LKTAQNDENARRRGRPRASGPTRRWNDYLEIVRRVRPGPGQETSELFAYMLREHGSAVQKTLTTFRRVLSGAARARPGFAAALADALRLGEMNSGADDFDLPPAEFETRLQGSPPPSLAQLFLRAADGTRLQLEADPLEGVRAFGRQAGLAVLDVGVSYALSIARPEARAGTQGPLLLVGYGKGDRRWQFVSAVADHPLSPATVVQWSRLTGVSLTPSEQPGTFVLYALGGRRPFDNSLTVLFERHRDGSAYLNDADVAAVRRAVERAVDQGGWSASLEYALRG